MGNERNVNKSSVEFMFGQVLTELESIKTKVGDNHTEILSKVEPMEQRLDKLERVKQWVVSGAVVGGSGGGAAWWQKLFGS